MSTPMLTTFLAALLLVGMLLLRLYTPQDAPQATVEDGGASGTEPVSVAAPARLETDAASAIGANRAAQPRPMGPGQEPSGIPTAGDDTPSSPEEAALVASLSNDADTETVRAALSSLIQSGLGLAPEDFPDPVDLPAADATATDGAPLDGG